jgi:hypothetical protein
MSLWLTSLLDLTRVYGLLLPTPPRADKCVAIAMTNIILFKSYCYYALLSHCTVQILIHTVLVCPHAHNPTIDENTPQVFVERNI